MAIVKSSVVIHAPVDEVMALSKDIERFPEFMKEVDAVEIVEREPEGRVLSRWKASIPEMRLSVKWLEEDLWSDAERTCRFRQIEGDYGKLEGIWTFTPIPEGTRFDSQLEIEYDVPLIGALLKGLIAKKAKENLDATLEAIKRRAEGQK
jgi:uncharacterized membrane protein